MTNNILISSAGRRVELVESFQKSLRDLSVVGKVFCSDMCPELSSACQIADGYFSVPKATDKNYIDTLLDLCRQYSIKLLIPTIDTELLVLSNARERFLEIGTNVIVSNVSLISQCRDKRQTVALFEQLAVSQPEILDKHNLKFPCFVKPYDGSCSIGAMALNSKEELTTELLNDPKNMFMELIPKSYSEYTVDVYFDKSGKLKCLVPRKRLEVRGGEVSKGITKKNFVYDYLLERLTGLKDALGCITVQVFVNEETKSVKGLEINPRFGGGYPLTDAANGTYACWLVQEYILKEEVEFYDNWESELLMLRYDAKVISRAYK